MQDPADRRRRRFPETFALQMPRDRHRPGIRPGASQLPAQLDDPLDNDLRRCLRAGPRTPGPRLKGVQAALAEAGEEAVQMPAGDPVLGGDRGNGSCLETT